jgi:ribosomal-protein-alanine N-acetyltransferase
VRLAGIHSAGVADSQAIATLHASCFEEPWSAFAVRDLLDSFGVFAFATRVEDTLTGFVIWRAVAEDSEILSLAVHMHFRRRGLGTRLLGASLVGARSHGATQVFIEVDAQDQGAKRFYETAAFNLIGRRRGYYPHRNRGNSDALVLTRRLTPLTATDPFVFETAAGKPDRDRD